MAQIRGTDVFAKNIETPDDYTAVCFNFNTGEKAAIEPGGGGTISPDWLVRAMKTMKRMHFAEEASIRSSASPSSKAMSARLFFLHAKFRARRFQFLQTERAPLRF